MKRSFGGAVVLISGAAGGLGRALAHRFGRAGSRLLLLDLDAAAVEALASELAASGVEARVVVVESTGSETHLVVDAAGTKLTCVLRERIAVRPGDQVRLGSDSAHLHLFHADSGERIEHLQYIQKEHIQ